MKLNRMTSDKKAKEIAKLTKSQIKTIFSEFGDVVENEYIDSLFITNQGNLSSVQVQKTSGVNIKLVLKSRGKIISRETF